MVFSKLLDSSEEFERKYIYMYLFYIIKKKKIHQIKIGSFNAKRKMKPGYFRSHSDHKRNTGF